MGGGVERGRPWLTRQWSTFGLQVECKEDKVGKGRERGQVRGSGRIIESPNRGKEYLRGSTRGNIDIV